MKEFEWRENFLDAVSSCSEEGRISVGYIRTHKTHIGFRRARRNVGAFWRLLTKSIYINSVHFSRESSLGDPNVWALLIHEVRHLQQGWSVALSIYGELDAWQIQFRMLKKVTHTQLHPALEEILSLPLNMDRANLRRARRLMTGFAGIMYGAYLYPLYPINEEIQYWVMGKIE